MITYVIGQITTVPKTAFWVRFPWLLPSSQSFLMVSGSTVLFRGCNIPQCLCVRLLSTIQSQVCQCIYSLRHASEAGQPGEAYKVGWCESIRFQSDSPSPALKFYQPQAGVFSDTRETRVAVCGKTQHGNSLGTERVCWAKSRRPGGHPPVS